MHAVTAHFVAPAQIVAPGTGRQYVQELTAQIVAPAQFVAWRQIVPLVQFPICDLNGDNLCR